MTQINGRGAPPAIIRDRNLAESAEKLGKASSAEIREAGKEIAGAGKQLNEAGVSTLEGVGHVVDATFDATKATGNTAKGVGAAILGGAARVGEVVADALGSALQWLGKALIKAGNGARELAGNGGAQVTTQSILGDPRADLFSDKMFKVSSQAFDVAGKQWLRSLDHLADGGKDLATAAGHVLSAAEMTLVAAGHAGNAVALKAAQGAVIVAKEALMAAEQGVDTAGALLQQAGQAVIAAGNQVNTAHGNDTAVKSPARN